MKKPQTGAEIRQSFIDFFISKGHTVVASSSLVPGGDQTLLFTNAGMVQFKDVFLGTDHRPYTRAVNSQKCMRVAGKHNDLDEVGRDNAHHTFFEMLGNWSFGDYYKKEAISWAWELLTSVWGLDKSKLWVTVFKDDKGNIPTDEEAAEAWRQQPGINLEHVLYFGRKDNLWEMAETGPCGPDSEIHIDLGAEACDKQGVSGHECKVNGDCKRFLEIWNLVFIQYNRLNPTELEPLPTKHVDTGMGFDRIVSIMQGVYNNYKTDLFAPLLDEVQRITGHTQKQRDEACTPYRVIADHSRASAFLIADGVVPGNVGRGYILRMIIRRAARFGRKIGLMQPFLASVAAQVIDIYGNAFPELVRNRNAILNNLTREEERFQRTVDIGLSHLDELLNELKATSQVVLDGKKAFDLYATLGLPFEITRDIAREQGLEVDEIAYRQALAEHRLASGSSKSFTSMRGEGVEFYRSILTELVEEGKIEPRGVPSDPYHALAVEVPILAILKDGIAEQEASEGELVEVIIPSSCFYIESGGQVSDTGTIRSIDEPRWEIAVEEIQKPAAGVIVHVGHVMVGEPKVGDKAIAAVDLTRRQDIMRNHTATHLLQAELRSILGDHVRQAGSLVAPDHLRFDFTHPDGMTREQLEKVEAGVNRVILENHRLKIASKPLAQAVAEGAMALFGEKYSETVRTITIGDADLISYELCGGTHVGETGDIGLFLITGESSAAAGVRRIEAVTGRGAYALVQHRFGLLAKTGALLECSLEEIPTKVQAILNDQHSTEKLVVRLRQELAGKEFEQLLDQVPLIHGIPVLSAILSGADAETLRQMTDRFRQKHASGIVVLGSVFDNRPLIIAAVTEDLVKKGLHAGDLVKEIARLIGGSGGGRPNLAQAGGRTPETLQDALDAVRSYLQKRL